MFPALQPVHLTALWPWIKHLPPACWSTFRLIFYKMTVSVQVWYGGKGISIDSSLLFMFLYVIQMLLLLTLFFYSEVLFVSSIVSIILPYSVDVVSTLFYLNYCHISQGSMGLHLWSSHHLGSERDYVVSVSGNSIAAVEFVWLFDG